MTPAEVREVMRRLWTNNERVLQHLYALDHKLSKQTDRLLPTPDKQALLSAAGFRTTYQMFFVQTVAVPPSNVRPLMRMGDMTFEHPQNVALTQVCPLMVTCMQAPYPCHLLPIREQHCHRYLSLLKGNHKSRS
jgi:DNA-directed RNA polymerase I subunit RPA1